MDRYGQRPVFDPGMMQQLISALMGFGFGGGNGGSTGLPQALRNYQPGLQGIGQVQYNGQNFNPGMVQRSQNAQNNQNPQRPTLPQQAAPQAQQQMQRTPGPSVIAQPYNRPSYVSPGVRPSMAPRQAPNQNVAQGSRGTRGPSY